MSKVDRIFEDSHPGTGEFRFDENVANVFDDMISRSVPLYADVQRAIPRLAGRLEQPSVTVVDLGCSTGASFRSLSDGLPDRNLRLIGVDSSSPMLDKCRKRLRDLPDHHPVHLVQADLMDYDIPGCHVVLMNYTLQFVPVEKRLDLLTRIRRALRPGGFLLMSEKFSHDDVELDRLLYDLYFDFKRRNGYSELEIARKRDALENVLVPYSVPENQQLLVQAGFGRQELLLKWFNFGTFLAFV